MSEQNFIKEAQGAIERARQLVEDKKRQKASDAAKGAEKVKNIWSDGRAMQAKAEEGECVIAEMDQLEAGDEKLPLSGTPEYQATKERVAEIRGALEETKAESAGLMQNPDVAGLIEKEAGDENIKFNEAKEVERVREEGEAFLEQTKTEIQELLDGPCSKGFEEIMFQLRSLVAEASRKEDRFNRAQENVDRIVAESLAMLNRGKEGEARSAFRRILESLNSNSNYGDVVKRVSGIKCSLFGDGDIKKAIGHIQDHEKDFVELDEARDERDQINQGMYASTKSEFLKALGEKVIGPVEKKFSDLVAELKSRNVWKGQIPIPVGLEEIRMTYYGGEIGSYEIGHLISHWIEEKGMAVLEKELKTTIMRKENGRAEGKILKEGKYDGPYEAIREKTQMGGDKGVATLADLIARHLQREMFQFEMASIDKENRASIEEGKGRFQESLEK